MARSCKISGTPQKQPVSCRQLDSLAFQFFCDPLANQDGLAILDDVLDQVIAGGARAFRQAGFVVNFKFEVHVRLARLIEGDIEAAHVEQAAHLAVNSFEERIGFERGAEDAADFVQDVQLFAAARSLLHEIAIFDGQADLMAEREKKAKFGGGEFAAVGSAEEEHAEDALFGLQADSYDGEESLAEKLFADCFEGRLALEGFPIGIALEFRENHQAAEARDHFHHVNIEALILHGFAESAAEAGGDYRCGTFGIAVVQAERAGWNAGYVEDAVERLGEHFLDFAAGEAGSGEIEAGKREHVALDAAALLFVDAHDHQHAGEELRHDDEQAEIFARERRDHGLNGVERDEQAPGGEGQREQCIRARFLIAADLGENTGHEQKQQSCAE